MKERFLVHKQRSSSRLLASPGVAVCAYMLTLLPCNGVTRSPEAAFTVSPHTLEGVVSEQVRLELELSQEEAAWQRQRDHLDALLTLRKTEKERLEKNSIEQVTYENKGQAERAKLTLQNKEARQLLSEVETRAAQAEERLLAIYDRLPEPLRLKLKPSMHTLRTRLKSAPAPEQTSERLRTVAAFGADLQRTFSETHAVKQVITLGHGQRIEVEALYLGGFLGFYLAPDHLQAGFLTPTAKGWKEEPQDGLAGQLARALAIKRKESPPTLVRLPLQLPKGEGGHQP